MVNYTFSMMDMLIIAMIICAIASYILAWLREKKIISDKDGDELIKLMNVLKPIVLAKVNEASPNSTQFVDYIFKGVADTWNDEADKTMPSKVATIATAMESISANAAPVVKQEPVKP